MLLGFTFFGFQLGFLLMVGAWVMMLVFLQKYPMPAATRPTDAWTRWSQFMRGEGFPAEAQPRRKLIAWMFRAALALFAIGLVAFFAAGGPDALPAPPTR